MYSQINVYPNPAHTGEPQLTISGYEEIAKVTEAQIQIINMTGEVVFTDRVSCDGDCSAYLIKLNKQLVPGIYVVNIHLNGFRIAKRLLVK